MSRKITVAVIGPPDLTDVVCSVAAEFPALEAVPYPYDHESETESLVIASQQTSTALLFTGVLPYRIAELAGLLDRPAVYIRYTGASLYLALLRLALDGEPIERFSIDTLSRQQVHEALEEAGLRTEHVAVYEYGSLVQDDDLVRFHQQAHTKHGTTVAILCLRSAYEALNAVAGDDLRTVRLRPALSSIRGAIESLLSTTLRQRTQHAQIALGIVELSGPGEPGDGDKIGSLRRHGASLGGSVVPRDDDTFLLITTRGVLQEATGGFRTLPMLEELGAQYDRAHIGFGIGRSGADAEVLARSALRRARSAGDVGAAVSLNADTIVALSPSGDVEPLSLPLLAQRVGMRQETLEKLRELLATREERVLTATDVAEHFAVEPRTGRRTLVKLARAGLAEPVGKRQQGASGRPAIEYQVYL